MILTNTQAIELCKNPVNSAAIKKAAELQDEHKVHVTGVGYDEYIKQIIGYEDAEQYAQKKELAEAVTTVLTGRIIDEQSRWKNTAGPKEFFEWKNNADRRKSFKAVLDHVWKGESMDYFINNFLSDALYTEFNGFIIVEQGKIEQDGDIVYEIRDGIKSVVKDKKIKPYLIFRPIELIHDFVSKGNKVEYLIIKWGEIEDTDGESIDLFRVIDDTYDRIVERKGKDWAISKKKGYAPIKNILGAVPAVQVSSIRQSPIVDEVKTSPIWRTIPLLKTYLTDWAEHVITCILHSHPIYYQMGQMCRYHDEDGNKCDQGTIYYKDAEGQPHSKECPACKGTGSVLSKTASSAIILPQVDDQGSAFSISNVAGYVSPPVQAIKEQREELNWLADMILQSGTGMNKVMETQIEKTATEAMLNYKPLEKKISDILSNIEYIRTALTDFIGNLYYGDYLQSQITYTRQLNLRDENTVLKEIEQAKQAGASASHVKTLHTELIFTRYQNSPIELERNLMLSQLEPFVGYTPADLTKNFVGYVDESTMIMKVYFVDYIVRFENEHVLITDFKENKDMNTRLNEIKVILDGYNMSMVEKIRAAKVADAKLQSTGNEA